VAHVFNVVIAGWLTWVRPDREKLRLQRERDLIGEGFPAR
jgi:hypothetical protein